VVVFDDDRFYMASVLVEMIVKAGFETVYVSPSPVVAAWTEHTLEQARIQQRLIQLGVKLFLSHNIRNLENDQLDVVCCYSGNSTAIRCSNLVSVTSRLARNECWNELSNVEHDWSAAGIKTVNRIGDCAVPGLIATAVRDGYAYAQAAGGTQVQMFKREDIQTLGR